MFPQIASGDLDVAVLGQLPSPQLSLDCKLEPSALKMESVQASLRRG
jgi:hypothetical protein